jgi:hypothetical protein
MIQGTIDIIWGTIGVIQGTIGTLKKPTGSEISLVELVELNLHYFTRARHLLVL